MSFWSRIKSVAKKVWRVVKAVARIVVRIIVFGLTLPFKVWDWIFGFLCWPRKRMKVHIAVLRNAQGPLISYEDLPNLQPSIDLLKTIYKDGCNVRVQPYSSGNKREIDNWAQIISDAPPSDALRSRCGVGASLWYEFTEAGEFFARHLAGWVGIPITLSFPITVFIVESIKDDSGHSYFGCTIPFLTDYVLVTVDALKQEPSTIAHEIGHSCGIPKEDSNSTYLMFSGNSPNLPPYRLRWWHKNVIRASRHATYLF
jgi:hypothetical protein